MMTNPLSNSAASDTSSRARRDSFASRLLKHRLGMLRHGEVVLVDAGETLRFGQREADCPLSVTVQVHDTRFYNEVVLGGSVGAGEAYVNGYWSASDLTILMRILLRNRYVLDGLEGGLARLTHPLRKALHWLHRGTQRGARRNIAAHYDLGNDLFALFLDPTMMYSSAIFDHPAMTLEAAQNHRLDRICFKLQLRPQDHLLEIGSGWGALAMHAARVYGCKVTTTTVSQQQFELTSQRVRDAGLSSQITVLLQDYRELRGQFDKLVSIEMIEAVGHQYYDGYFRQCSQLLKPDGVMLLQAITIADQQYESARRSVDFIQRHIFPGSCIPCISVLCASLARSGDMKLRHLEDIGPHYATTLQRWRENFFRNIDQVRALGYSEPFIRMWEFYLCYCEGGFEERALGDVQMLLVKPDNRDTLTVPAIEG